MLSGGAVARIAGSKLQELVITNSIQPTPGGRWTRHNIRVVSIADLIGEAISRTATEESSRACSTEAAATAARRLIRRCFASARRQILHMDGKFSRPVPCGVVDGIGDGRPRTANSQFANSLAAERVRMLVETVEHVDLEA